LAPANDGSTVPLKDFILGTFASGLETRLTSSADYDADPDIEQYFTLRKMVIGPSMLVGLPTGTVDIDCANTTTYATGDTATITITLAAAPGYYLDETSSTIGASGDTLADFIGDQDTAGNWKAVGTTPGTDSIIEATLNSDKTELTVVITIVLQ
jgi:hypothetical protein